MITPGGDFRSSDRGDVLERRHLAEGHPLLFQPCPDRRPGRRRRRQCRADRRPMVRAEQDPVAIFLSPMLGMLLAMLIMLVTSWLAVRASARGAKRTSGPSISSPRPPIRSATAPTTRRRRWGSSPSCSIRPAISEASSTSPTGWRQLLRRDRPRHAERRLADHPDDGHRDNQAVAAPGLLRLDGRVDDAVLRLLARHPGFDHPHDHRLRSSAPARHGGPRRSAGASPERRHRLDRHHPRLGVRRGVFYWITTLF